MMHRSRRWSVSPVATAEELAQMLADGRTWTLCAGFYVEGYPEYLFLNDSTSEDALTEYAVVLGGLSAERHRQVESITFSWCDYEEALAFIRAATAGEYDEESFAHDLEVCRVQTPAEHGDCARCR